MIINIVYLFYFQHGTPSDFYMLFSGKASVEVKGVGVLNELSCLDCWGELGNMLVFINVVCVLIFLEKLQHFWRTSFDLQLLPQLRGANFLSFLFRNANGCQNFFTMKILQVLLLL